MALNSDQKIALQDISDTDGIIVLLSQMRTMLSDMEHRVISLNTDDIDERKLFVRKARAEGARMMVRATEKFVQDIKEDRLGA